MRVLWNHCIVAVIAFWELPFIGMMNVFWLFLLTCQYAFVEIMNTCITFVVSPSYLIIATLQSIKTFGVNHIYKSFAYQLRARF